MRVSAGRACAADPLLLRHVNLHQRCCGRATDDTPGWHEGGTVTRAQPHLTFSAPLHITAHMRASALDGGKQACRVPVDPYVLVIENRARVNRQVVVRHETAP